MNVENKRKLSFQSNIFEAFFFLRHYYKYHSEEEREAETPWNRRHMANENDSPETRRIMSNFAKFKKLAPCKKGFLKNPTPTPKPQINSFFC